MNPEEHTDAARPRASETARRFGRRREVLLVADLVVALTLTLAAVWGVTSLRSSAPPPTGTNARAAEAGRSAAASGAAGPATEAASPSGTPPAGSSLEPYEWARRFGLIAHGFGSIGGLTVTSTREAFEANYKRGYRIFEVDLVLTRDGFVVGRHDWSASRFARFGQNAPPTGVPTLQEFRASLVKDKYHPVDAAEIVDLMRRYPDAWVMTDLKIDTVVGRTKALRQLLTAAKGDISIRRRLIVQIYEEADLQPTRALGIDNLLYTFYRLKTPVAQALDFSKRNGIKVITIPVSSASRSRVDDIRGHGLICAVHTLNDAEHVASLRKRGVALVYSDSLRP